MPQKKLSAVTIPRLAEGEWWDALLPGLILRVGKKRRSWSVRYHSNGSYPRKRLGHFPAMELAAARDAARRVIERADRGLPAEAANPHPRSADVLTLGDLFDDYEKLRKREGRKIKTLDEAMRLLRFNLAPYLSMPADQFSKADLRAARDAMVKRDAMLAGNRLLQRLGPVLKWAAQEDLIATNFTPDVRKAPELKRTRKLTDAEIRSLGRLQRSQQQRRGKKLRALVKFLLLTAQRKDEVGSLRSGHILDGIWRQADNKSSRPHSLRLPPMALKLVAHGGARDYVFAGSVGKISGFSKLKAALDEASGVRDWRLHDLRRTAATNMQELGIRNEVVQAILNHAVPGVGGVYLRSELEKEKADALAKWAVALTKIVGLVAERRA